MSLEILSYLTMVDFAVRAILASVFGKFIDKVGEKKIVFFGTIILGSAYGTYVFVTAVNVVVLRIVISVLTAASNAMLGPSLFVFQMKSLPEENRTSALSCVSEVLFLVGTVASWITTCIISVANGFRLELFGIEFHEMHLIFITVTIVLFIAAASLMFTAKNGKIENKNKKKSGNFLKIIIP